MNIILNTSTKFDGLTVDETGLILINKRKVENTLLFSEIKKIYIKKNKFSFLQKAGIVTVLFVLLTISTFYLPTEIVLSASFLFIPLMVKLNNFKWYHLCLLDQETTLYYKIFYSNNKEEHINFVNTVKNEIYYNQIKPLIQNAEVEERDVILEDFTLSNLSIA